MEKLIVVKLQSESIEFSDGTILTSNHDSDCCENHYLSMEDLSLSDFNGLEFDLSNDKFFNRIDGYGIELVPLSGFSVKIPGYGYNNGFYSSNLDLVVKRKNKVTTYDISECQDITD